MRALCGAIIAAGAFIGLGLTAMGIGSRYQMEHAHNDKGEPILVRLSQMDRPLVFILVFLTSAAVIGLGVTFLGLVYHHVRREREYELSKERVGARPRTAV